MQSNILSTKLWSVVDLEHKYSVKYIFNINVHRSKLIMHYIACKLMIAKLEFLIIELKFEIKHYIVYKSIFRTANLA
jgi:hypothetical protein